MNLLHTMTFNELPAFLTYLFKSIEEEDLWDAWKSNPFREGTFEDFKDEVKEASRAKSMTKEQKEFEAKEAERKVLDFFGKKGG